MERCKSVYSEPKVTLVTHKIYGVPQTINTGNYVYFLAYRELLLLREPAKGIDVEKLVTGNHMHDIEYMVAHAEQTSYCPFTGAKDLNFFGETRSNAPRRMSTSTW